MADYAYMTATGKIRPFLDKIREVGVPDKATQAWLVSIGFASTNDRALLPIMKQIGLLDPGGKPTSAWEEVRRGDKRALARAIRRGYPAFFATYPDAHRRSTAELEHIVRGGAPKLGRDAVGRAVSTFKALAAAAEFDEASSPGAATAPATASGTPRPAPDRGAPADVTINVTIQVTLPDTSDELAYARLFAAIREQLLQGVPDRS